MSYFFILYAAFRIQQGMREPSVLTPLSTMNTGTPRFCLSTRAKLNILINSYLIPRVGIEPTTVALQSHACATCQCGLSYRMYVYRISYIVVLKPCPLVKRNYIISYIYAYS